MQAQREKLQAKIAALQMELDPERLGQEIALLAQKADVDEEPDRLDTHVAVELKVLIEQMREQVQNIE